MQVHYVGFLVTLIVFGTRVLALRLDVHGERKHSTQRISRRGPGVTSSDLNNTADVSYYVDLKLGGKPFQVLLDTGSSDLWVAGDVPNSKSTQFTSGVNYAVGGVHGPIKTTELQFVGHTIPDQAYLQITPDNENKDGDGILGLGPNSASNIFQDMNSNAGAAVLDRIFMQNTTTPNYITVLLGRSDDPTDLYSGSITIGEILEGFENVTNQPKLPVVDVPIDRRTDQHFQLLLDEDGLIGPDGNSIRLRTDVATTANKKQVTAVIDTGFSLPQLPRAASAAIYSRFHGAELVNIATIGQVWILPCSQEVNITFRFGGKNLPIHPLDATLVPETIGVTNIVNSRGQVSCIGTFQPMSYDTGFSPNYDMVLGMAFLRNVYLLMDYGDFILGTTEKDDPYIQFLSLTDPVEAHGDFVKMRLNGVDTTGESGLVDSKAPVSSRTVSYIVAAVVVVLILTCVGGFIIYKARRNRRRRPDFPAPEMTYGATAPPHVTSPPTIYLPQQPNYTIPHSPAYTPQHPIYSPPITNQFQGPPPTYNQHQPPYNYPTPHTS
ncbi:aspartic peptidase domain-containing protein [Collybia nuda]|uniref:Aspartic peptidase domain-containing protein n=1 Tax=Collybia nuda TaxID=64659 RepID=A0A9P5Y979_9AGAR|nr:aspartic peptidase domain-containing protein [Collybia nuda]